MKVSEEAVRQVLGGFLSGVLLGGITSGLSYPAITGDSPGVAGATVAGGMIFGLLGLVIAFLVQVLRKE